MRCQTLPTIFLNPHGMKGPFASDLCQTNYAVGSWYYLFLLSIFLSPFQILHNFYNFLIFIVRYIDKHICFTSDYLETSSTITKKYDFLIIFSCI